MANLANALRQGKWVPRPEAKCQNSEVRELLPSNSTQLSKKPMRVHQFADEPFSAGWIEFHSEHELILDWYVQNMEEARVQYPFTFDPYPDSGPPYFYVRVILGNEYFYWTGENVMPFPDEATKCQCGEQLVYDAGWAHGTGSERIHRSCLNCGRLFDPSKFACDVLDGWTGEPHALKGGLAFRFALAVDCHKYRPREEEAFRKFKLREDFLDLWRTCISVPFEQVVTAD